MRSSRRLRIGAGAVLIGSAAWHLLEAFELRRRLGAAAVLAPPPAGVGAPPAIEVDTITADGVVLDDDTRAAAAHTMDVAGLDLLDLVPADLAVEPALRLLRRVNPDRLGQEPRVSPGGAGDAVLVRRSLGERMRSTVGGRPGQSAVVGLTVRAQRYTTAAGMRVAPGVRAVRRTPLDRWREIDELTAFTRPYVRLAPAIAGAETVQGLALAAGAALAPVPGALAILAWSAKPALVFGGAAEGSLRPAGIGRASLLRLPRSVAAGAATLVAGYRDTRGTEHPTPAVPPPEHERFEDRHDTCPWCGSAALQGLVDVGDLLQQKPGRFHLDRCEGCGHVFQNPALSPAGLDYYYDQFYDGAGEGLSEVMFGGLERSDRQRIAAIDAVTDPKAWLDVGCGYGHFCARARQHWPGARFDGLDMGVTVEDAERRGVLDNAHQGLLVDVAPGLAGTYDVVSMHHYLEHTRDPRRELQAADEVLVPGGHLMIEVPDPESPWALRLGRWCHMWFQPQHQHFVPCANLIAELEDRGFAVVSVERGPATLSGELLGATVFALQSVTRSPDLPWLPPPTRWQRIARGAAITVAAPVMAAALLADLAKDVARRPDSVGNAYRIVARKPLSP
jgi:SAM-dependent methyltransferase